MSLPVVKSTFEMDGLFTQEDIDNRFFIMAQCLDCNQWTQHDSREQGKHDYGKCENCGSTKYNMREARSIRSWQATKDVKEKKRGKNKGEIRS